jgi:hypothetical protein
MRANLYLNRRVHFTWKDTPMLGTVAESFADGSMIVAIANRDYLVAAGAVAFVEPETVTF